MATDTASRLYPVAEIGTWTQSGETIGYLAQCPEIWEPPCSEMSRAELTDAIARNGGVTEDHALEATTHQDGAVTLDNGLHRWAVAYDLGYQVVPVVMAVESAALTGEET